MLNLNPHLTHEVWYHPVKDGVLKAKTSLSSTENPEVLRRLGDNMREQLDGDGTKWFLVGCYFEEHPWVGLSGVLLDPGHLMYGGARGVATGEVHVLLTSTEDFLEGFSDVCAFKFSCQLLHNTVALWFKKQNAYKYKTPHRNSKGKSSTSANLESKPNDVRVLFQFLLEAVCLNPEFKELTQSACLPAWSVAVQTSVLAEAFMAWRSIPCVMVWLAQTLSTCSRLIKTR